MDQNLTGITKKNYHGIVSFKVRAEQGSSPTASVDNVKCYTRNNMYIQPTDTVRENLYT